MSCEEDVLKIQKKLSKIVSGEKSVGKFDKLSYNIMYRQGGLLLLAPGKVYCIV